MRASTGTLLWRAARRRCPQCGARHLFLHWFQMAPHCPGCGVRLRREDGYFLGVFFINIVVTQTVVFGWIIGVFTLTHPHTNVPAAAAVALGLAVVVPLVFYPFAQALWAAIHLAMAPLEPEEEAEAAVFRFERGDAA